MVAETTFSLGQKPHQSYRTTDPEAPLLQIQSCALTGSRSNHACKNLECDPVLVGGVEDHVHLLCRLGRTISQSDWIREVKRVSSAWLKEQRPDLQAFQWEGGYADF